jgi:hypothetical protein
LVAGAFRISLGLATTVAVLMAGSSASSVAAPSGVERREFCERSEVEVLQPKFMPKLRLVRKVFHPGETAYARLENRGSAAIFFGYPYAVEQFVDGSWIEAPDPPGPFLLPQFRMEAGEVGSCITYRVPDEIEAGTFRFVRGATSEDHRRRMLRASFRVAIP